MKISSVILKEALHWEVDKCDLVELLVAFYITDYSVFLKYTVKGEGGMRDCFWFFCSYFYRDVFKKVILGEFCVPLLSLSQLYWKDQKGSILSLML